MLLFYGPIKTIRMSVEEHKGITLYEILFTFPFILIILLPSQLLVDLIFVTYLTTKYLCNILYKATISIKFKTINLKGSENENKHRKI